MNICKKCGAIMIPTKKGKNKYLVCTSCKYKEKITTHSKLITKAEKSKIAVIEKDQIMLPSIHKICPKCGNEKAYWWTGQGKGEEMSEAQFFKCKKCGYTWKEE
jgi:DNA-directed RNA polymerase subunit M